MATWYIDPTAAYNGNGTAPTPASADGQPGAWNSLVAVLTNNTTYPIAAGDIIYVRSATGAGADISVNITSTFTMAVRGTDALPVFWILDNGTIWNYAGQLTMNISTGLTINFAENNWMKSFNRRWRWLHNQGNSTVTGFSFAASEYDSLVFKTANNNQSSFQLITSGVAKNVRWVDCLFAISQTYSLASTLLSLAQAHGLYELIQCDFDLTGIPTAPGAMINLYNFGTMLRVIGGRVINGSETTEFARLGSFSSGIIDVVVDGTNIGPLKPFGITSADPPTSISRIGLLFTNINNNKYRMAYKSFLGSVDWTPNSNYPVLNAMLPDVDSTPWSLKILPSTTLASISYPLTLSRMVKFYDIAEAARQIQVELLICDTYPTLRKRDWWILVSYVDPSTGNQVSLNTFDLFGNLDVSTAEWSSTIYGAKSYLKRKIVVNTPTNIKQYTDIIVEVRSAIAAPSLTDFYFVDPEFTVI